MDVRQLHLRTPLSSSTRLSSCRSCWSKAAPMSSMWRGTSRGRPTGGVAAGQSPPCMQALRSRIPFPQLVGAPCKGPLIRDDLGQRRLRLHLSIRILRVHARRHAHPCHLRHLVTEGIDRAGQRPPISPMCPWWQCPDPTLATPEAPERHKPSAVLPPPPRELPVSSDVWRAACPEPVNRPAA